MNDADSIALTEEEMAEALRDLDEDFDNETFRREFGLDEEVEHEWDHAIRLGWRSAYD